MSFHTRRILFAAILIAFVSSSYADLIGDVCAKAANPPSCNKIVRSAPGAVQAQDIGSLGSAVIDSAQSFSKAAQNLASSLAKTTQDPKIKESLDTCVENFDDAIESLNECRESLTKNDKVSLNIQASAAYTDADTCNDNFEGQRPQNLSQVTQNVIDICSALLSLSNQL